MPLTNTVALLRTINPKFQFREQVETIWPFDRSNPSAQPPSDAPRSTIQVVAEWLDGKGGVETFDVAFARHPNAPIVIALQRKLGWAPTAGPSFDALVQDLRKKYGAESLITSQTTNNVQREMLCGTLVVLDTAVLAGGNGVVNELRVAVESHPLTQSARLATEAYLKAVEEDRTKRQQNESTGRARPTL